MSNQRMRWKKLSMLLAASGLGASPHAMAASFQVLEQSAAHLGSAYAGTAASSDDATTAFYNAAGLTRLRGHNVSASFIELLPHIRLNAQTALPPVQYAPNIGPGKATVHGNAFIPTLHYAFANHGPWAFGFSINAPFGLISKYNGDSVARYMATRSVLATTNFSPSIAYQVVDNISVGAGLDATLIRAHLDTAIGYGGSPSTDGYINLKAHGHGLGWHLGVLWDLEDTNLGLNYRSQVKTKLKGTEYQRQMTYAAAGQYGTPSQVNAWGKITLPDVATFSIKQKIDEQWTALADVQWTHWAKFQQLAIYDATPMETVTYENYRDAYRLSLGGQYRQGNGLTWRAGVAFDQSPARPAYRTARIPDSDRTWLTVGARYRVTPNLVVDAGLAHIFFKKSSINEHAPTRYVNGVPSTHPSYASLKGQYKGSANIIGIQLSWNPV